ncbi:MAG: hypothetical protein OXG62_16955 [Nitrospinae bacterium]|nr:hypothetical protein [Nitrospinota bacterium]
MPDYKITNHAEIRMSQRAVRDEDAVEVLTCGTQIGPVEWFMRDSDADREIDDLKDKIKWIDRMRKLKVMNGADANREISALKHEVRRFERLRGLKVVMEGGEIITCYWPSVAYQKRARRRGRAA